LGARSSSGALDRLKKVMKKDTTPSKVTVLTYAIFWFLVVADLLMSVFSEAHLNAFGNVRGIGGVAFRFFPDLCLLAFYTYFFFSLICFGKANRLSVLIHSGILIPLGLGLAIPFMGLILSMLTPVALLYILIILYISSGYFAVVLLAIILSLINLWIMILEFRNKTRINCIEAV
jgi:hypothetical protein